MYRTVQLPQELTKACAEPLLLQDGTAGSLYKTAAGNALALRECSAKHQALLRISSTLFQKPEQGLIEPALGNKESMRNAGAPNRN